MRIEIEINQKELNIIHNHLVKKTIAVIGGLDTLQPIDKLLRKIFDKYNDKLIHPLE